jgi:UDP-3-O-[3-hydroxymyristoyl] glucosamine N-acyltransferase
MPKRLRSSAGFYKIEMITIEKILAQFPPAAFTGNRQQTIKKVVELPAIRENADALSWCNVKNIPLLNDIFQGTLITPVLPRDFHKQPGVNYIEAENPRQYFLYVLKAFFEEKKPAGIASTASIAPGVILGDQVTIGHNVVIENGCTIGNHTSIGHNTVIFSHTQIGHHVSIGSNCTIGGNGFGYEKNNEQQYEMLPHIGNVIIHDHVEIAHNVCIDRAVLSSTVLHENVKVDNLVHIAHNVVIGKNSLIIANSMIGGSTVIGENVWVAPSSSIINKITIGNNALVGMGAVVIKPVNEGETVIGNPARPLQKK